MTIANGTPFNVGSGWLQLHTGGTGTGLFPSVSIAGVQDAADIPDSDCGISVVTNRPCIKDMT